MAFNPENQACVKQPEELYELAIQTGDISADSGQYQALETLNHIHHKLIAPAQKLQPWWWRWVKQEPGAGGAYLWGEVGRGKSMMLSMFFESLPFDNKKRLHYQQFIEMIQKERHRFKGLHDPLERIGQNWAQQFRVICIDEFEVTDITDAMIMSKLLSTMFDQKITLMLTSNLQPRDLYKQGLQRERFLPAIALIEKYMEIIEVGGNQDHRRQPGMESWTNQTNLAENWLEKFGGNIIQVKGAVEIHGRKIPVRAIYQHAIWFDFYSLCATARSARDYMLLAQQYPILVCSGVPVMSEDQDDQARRFMALVDEYYDRSGRVLAELAASPDQMYQGWRLRFAFKRTASRLHAMGFET